MKKLVFVFAIALLICLTSCKSSPVKNGDSASLRKNSSQTLSSSNSSSDTASSYNSGGGASSDSQASCQSSSSTAQSSSSTPRASSTTSSKTDNSDNSGNSVTPQTPAVQPLVFDDPLLEQLLRSYTKKASGDVFPSDFSAICSGSLQLFNQQIGANSTSDLRASSTGLGSDVNLSVNGTVKSYHAIENIPFKNISVASAYTGTASSLFTYDLQDFTTTGKLEYFTVFGNHETPYENQHIQSITLNNFSSISNCPNLSMLKLYDCQGVDLNPTISLPNLTYARFQNCGLNTLAALKNSSNLQTLELDYNPVTDLSPLVGSSSLKTLYLSNLSSVDVSTILSLPALKKLTLNDCPLISQGVFNQLVQKGVTVMFAQKGWSYNPTLPY